AISATASTLSGLAMSPPLFARLVFPPTCVGGRHPADHGRPQNRPQGPSDDKTPRRSSTGRDPLARQRQQKHRPPARAAPSSRDLRPPPREAEMTSGLRWNLS